MGRIKPSKKLAKDSREKSPTKQINTPVSLSFRYLQAGGKFCLSLCEKDAVREVMDCLRQLCTLPWMQVLQQGGKGEKKVGLAHTAYEDHALKGVTRPSFLSPDVRIAGLRASQEIRVFGFY